MESPGEWMSEKDLDQWIEHARKIAATSTSEDLEYGIIQGDREHLKNVIVTMVFDKKSNRAIAFNCLVYMDIEIKGKVEKVIHLGLVMVDPNFRASGFSWVLYGLTSILLFFRNQLQPIWVTNVTQVPAVFGAVCSSYSNSYPDVDGSKKTFDHIQIAHTMMAKYRGYFGVGVDAYFDDRKFIICNSYTGGSDGLKKTFDQATKHRKSKYNDFCEQYLDYERGDDILQIGQLNLEASKNYLLKNVPRTSLIAVISGLLFTILSSWLLPIYYWFRSDLHFGELRPWSEKHESNAE